MSDNTQDSGIDYNCHNSDCNRHPISPIIIIKTQNFKSFRKPKINCNEYVNVGTNITTYSTVWPKSLWFDGQCDRQRAEALLRTAKNGTFVIRKSREFEKRGSYAMSLAFDHNIYHCLIYKYSNGFGFNTKRVFRSLEDLVLHYKEFESLNVHNRILDCNLVIPGLKTVDNQTEVKFY